MQYVHVGLVCSFKNNFFWTGTGNIVGIRDQAYEKLFQFVSTNPNHVLSSLLPDETDHHYYLRARRHVRQLADKCYKFFSDNFMMCVLYRDSYCV